MRTFGKPSGRLRAAAALVSLSLTAAIFMLLRATSTPAPPKRSEPPVAVALLLSPPARPRPLPPTTPNELRASTRERRVVPSPRRASPPQAISEAIARPGPAAAPAEVAAAPRAAAEPASVPLRLDARTIRRAIAGSEGNIRQMAGKSGVDLDSAKESRSEALAGAVADKGVPDCLAPNGGGSLLSVPILLVLAMQGKCK